MEFFPVPPLAHLTVTVPASCRAQNTVSHPAELEEPDLASSTLSLESRALLSAFPSPPPMLSNTMPLDKVSPLDVSPAAYSDSEDDSLSPVQLRNQLFAAVQNDIREEEDSVEHGLRTAAVPTVVARHASSRAQTRQAYAPGWPAPGHHGPFIPVVMGDGVRGVAVFSTSWGYSSEGDSDESLESFDIGLHEYESESVNDKAGETDAKESRPDVSVRDVDELVAIDEAAINHTGSPGSTYSRGTTSSTGHSNIYAIAAPVTESLASPPPAYDQVVPAPAYHQSKEFGRIKRPMSVHEPRGPEPAAKPQSAIRTIDPETLFNALAMEVGTSKSASSRRQSTGSMRRLSDSIRCAWRRSLSPQRSRSSLPPTPLRRAVSSWAVRSSV